MKVLEKYCWCWRNKTPIKQISIQKSIIIVYSVLCLVTLLFPFPFFFLPEIFIINLAILKVVHFSGRSRILKTGEGGSSLPENFESILETSFIIILYSLNHVKWRGGVNITYLVRHRPSTEIFRVGKIYHLWKARRRWSVTDQISVLFCRGPFHQIFGSL